MSLRNDLLKIADSVRSIAGPSQLDQRTSQLTIRTRTWAGGRRDADPPNVGDPAYTDVDLVLPQIFPSRELSGAEVMGSGGSYATGDIALEHITPQYVDPADGLTKGFSPQQLKPTNTNEAVEILYIVSGANNGEYQAVDLVNYPPYSYKLILRKQRTTPSVT